MNYSKLYEEEAPMERVEREEAFSHTTHQIQQKSHILWSLTILIQKNLFIMRCDESSIVYNLCCVNWNYC